MRPTEEKQSTAEKLEVLKKKFAESVSQVAYHKRRAEREEDRARALASEIRELVKQVRLELDALESDTNL